MGPKMKNSQTKHCCERSELDISGKGINLQTCFIQKTMKVGTWPGCRILIYTLLTIGFLDNMHSRPKYHLLWLSPYFLLVIGCLLI